MHHASSDRRSAVAQAGRRVATTVAYVRLRQQLMLLDQRWRQQRACAAAAAGSAAVTTTDWSLLVETTTGQLHRAPLQANRSPTCSRPCGAHASFPGGTSRAPSPLLMAGEEPPPSLRPAWVNPLLR
ncbi:hypothetical protein ZWY2020_033521 [Hordeum vulgare]|nr:hypothetical protein ZWY2020_033521 [Hordeum vulgare]